MAKLNSDVHLANMFQKVNEDLRGGRIINGHEWAQKIQEYLLEHYGDAEYKNKVRKQC